MNANMQSLLEDVSREVVGDIAPDELDMFDELAEEHFEDPNPPTAEVTRGGGALSFGAGELLSASTPIIIAVMGVVLEFLLDIFREMVASQGADFAHNRIRSWFLTKDKPDLTAEQINQTRMAAKAEAVRYGLSDEQAEQMADAIMKRLITG